MPIPFQSYAEVPDQPGMLNFQRPDGSSVPLFGPAAEDYRRRIDALRALGPQPTAQAAPAMSVDPMQSDVPAPAPGFESSIDDAMSQPLSGGPVAPGVSAAQDGSGGGEWEASTGKMSRAAAPSQQAPAPQQQPQGPVDQRFFALDKSGGSILDAGSGQVITRGGGGMSPTQRDALEGQVDARRDDIERRADEQAHFVRAQAGLALEQARAEDQFVQQRMQDAQINAAIQAQNEAEIQSKLNQTLMLEERSRNSYRSGSIDRDRFFSGEKGGANKARAFLAIALGAFAQFGAGMAGRASSNPGLDMVLGRIDDDVADQERELNMKREDADNYLARAMKLDGNLATARLATKAALLEAYQTEALAIRNQTRQPQLKLTLDQKLAELDAIKQQTIAQLAALREQTLRANQARATTARPATVQEMQGALGLRKTQADIGQTEATTEKTGVETVGAARELSTPGGGKPKSSEEKRFAQVTDAAWGDLNDLVQRYGGQIDPKTGEIVGDLDLPTDYPGGDTSETAELKSRMVKLGTSYANQINAGAEAGQPTKEALTPNLNRVPGFDTSEGQLRAMARELWRSKQGLGTLPKAEVKQR